MISIHLFSFKSCDCFSNDTMGELQKYLNDFIEITSPPYQIIFDFEDVNYMSSLMAGHLIAIASAFNDTDNEVVACGLSEPMAELFHLMKIDKIVKIMTNRDAALKLLTDLTL